MLTSSTNADTRVGSIARLAQSWAISLAAENKSARTIGGYTETISQFVKFLTERGMPSIAAAIRREHVEAYLVDVLGRHRPSTAATRYKGLRIFFAWLREEGEITESNMKPPPSCPRSPPTCSPTTRCSGCSGRVRARRSPTGATLPSSGSSPTPGCAATS